MCFVAKLSTTTSPASPTSPPISPKQQQHRGSHGPDQLVVNKKQPEEKYEENQPVEATDGGTGNEQGELNCVAFEFHASKVAQKLLHHISGHWMEILVGKSTLPRFPLARYLYNVHDVC